MSAYPDDCQSPDFDPKRSTTPLTDAELQEICEGNQCFGYVRIEFARDLEKEMRKYRGALAAIARGDYAPGAEKAHPAVALAKRALANNVI